MDEHGGRLMEFERFLKINSLVHVDRLKYYLNWVDLFMKRRSYNVEAIDQDSLPAFLNSLRTDPRCKDWQITQAENAVRLFVVNFLKLDIRPKKPADLGAGEEVKALPWDESFKKMVESLRVRHYSYSF